MPAEATPPPAWLTPGRLIPDLLAGLWVLLVVMLYADGPFRASLDILRGLLER